MTIPLSNDTTLELRYGSPSEIVYSLSRRILSSSDFPPCPSYTLTVQTKSHTVILHDLTVHRERAHRIAELFFLERVLPENVPCILEDLLADETFIC